MVHKSLHQSIMEFPLYIGRVVYTWVLCIYGYGSFLLGMNLCHKLMCMKWVLKHKEWVMCVPTQPRVSFHIDKMNNNNNYYFF
jgi:hypothetical protein